jgi:hypothetical protein
MLAVSVKMQDFEESHDQALQRFAWRGKSHAMKQA